MSYLRPLSAFVLTLLGALPLAAQQPARHPRTEPSPSTLVAKVGGVGITWGELRAEVNRLIPLTFYHARVPEQRLLGLQREGLANLIERALIHLDAQRRGMQAEEEQVQERFRAALTDAGPAYSELTPKERAALLRRLRPKVVRRLLIDRNEARFESSIPALSEDDLRAHYELRKSDLRTPEEARFRHIFLQVDPAASAEQIDGREAEMASIEAHLAIGEAFEDLAKTHSDDIFAARGGDMGFIQRGSFSIRQVEEAAFALKDGEVSKVVLSLEGFHLVKRVETRPRRTLSFEEARAELEEGLVLERRRQAREAWMAELRGLSRVEFLVKELAPPAQAAGEGEKASGH
jgi:peptidyl-prolyl cis-trans isomerase C